MSDTRKSSITVIALFVVPLVFCVIILFAARDEAPNAAAVPAVVTESRSSQEQDSSGYSDWDDQQRTNREREAANDYAARKALDEKIASAVESAINRDTP